MHLRLAAIIILLFLLPSCGGSEGPAVYWTVMVYMDADNDLDVAAPLDLKEMLAIGSNAFVNVLVMYDSRSTTTKLYKVENQRLVLLQDPGELSMANPDTLRDFVVYAAKNYPASHYALILWDHGEGWQSGVDKRVPSIIEDWNNSNQKSLPLSNREIAQGIKAAEETAGIKIDILGVDACLMATLEAAYEFRDVADILVSSQDRVQGFGWDYKSLLGRLAVAPDMSPRDLAAAMVEIYRNFVESPAWGFGDQTISALFLGKRLEFLAAEVDKLAVRLKEEMDNPATRDAAIAKIAAARLAVQQLNPPIYVDLADFSVLLEPTVSPTPIQAALKDITIAEYHGSKRPNAHGLNIVFYDLPAAIRFSVYQGDYRNYDPNAGTGSRSAFINDLSWDEMMNTYFSYAYPGL